MHTRKYIYQRPQPNPAPREPRPPKEVPPGAKRPFSSLQRHTWRAAPTILRKTAAERERLISPVLPASAGWFCGTGIGIHRKAAGTAPEEAPASLRILKEI